MKRYLLSSSVPFAIAAMNAQAAQDREPQEAPQETKPVATIHTVTRQMRRSEQRKALKRMLKGIS